MRPTSATTVSTQGIPGNPALYQTANGGYTVVTFTNIQVTNAVGEPATGWTLVTGDAESTDTNEWMNFTTNHLVDPPELELVPLGQLVLRRPRHRGQRAVPLDRARSPQTTTAVGTLQYLSALRRQRHHSADADRNELPHGRLLHSVRIRPAAEQDRHPHAGQPRAGQPGCRKRSPSP